MPSSKYGEAENFNLKQARGISVVSAVEHLASSSSFVFALVPKKLRVGEGKVGASSARADLDLRVFVISSRGVTRGSPALCASSGIP